MKNVIKIISAMLIFIMPTANVSAEETFRRVYNENLLYEGIAVGSFREDFDIPDGIYPVQDKSTHRIGAVDNCGNIILPCQYKDIGVFKDGICSVITPDGENYFVNSKNEIVYKILNNSASNPANIRYIRHGNYGIFAYDDMYVWLVDSKFHNTVEGSLEFIKSNYYWYFVDDKTYTENVYNYKGENLTHRLEAEEVNPRNVFACGKYLGGTCTKEDKKYIKIFDINGSMIANFECEGCQSANSDFIIGYNGIIYSTKGKELFRLDSAENTDFLLFNNCVLISKRNGTCAVIDKDGNKVIDFGKWDAICPTANNNVYVVGIGSKYGLADKEGNLLLPLEYNLYGQLLQDNGKYVRLNDSKNQAHTINVFNMKSYDGEIKVQNGSKYIYAGLDGTLNDKFEYITSGGRMNADRLLLTGVIVANGELKNGRVDLDFKVLNDNGGTKVKVDGEYLTFEKFPEIVNGRTLVPLRKIFEAIGAEVIWNGTDQSITATKDNVAIKMQINNNTLIKNGQSTEMDVSPQLIDGFTMVPVRAISDCFNIIVDWNEYSHTVSLFTD